MDIDPDFYDTECRIINEKEQFDGCLVESHFLITNNCRWFYFIPIPDGMMEKFIESPDAFPVFHTEAQSEKVERCGSNFKSFIKNVLGYGHQYEGNESPSKEQ